ncbi:hypothetical protein D3C72_1691510 [compost metagenome]
MGGSSTIRSNWRPSARNSRRVLNTSASSQVARSGSKPLSVTLPAAIFSASPDESIEVTEVAPPRSAASEKPPV